MFLYNCGREMERRSDRSKLPKTSVSVIAGDEMTSATVESNAWYMFMCSEIVLGSLRNLTFTILRDFDMLLVSLILLRIVLRQAT